MSHSLSMTGVPDLLYLQRCAGESRRRSATSIIAPVVGLTYAPQLSALALSANSSLRQQFFYYSNDLSSFNFASFDAGRRSRLLRPEAAQPGAARRTSITIDSPAPDDFRFSFFSESTLSVLNAEVPFRYRTRPAVVAWRRTPTSAFTPTPQPPRRNDFRHLCVGYAANLSRNFSLNAAGNLGRAALRFRRPDGRERNSRLQRQLSQSANGSRSAAVSTFRRQPVESKRLRLQCLQYRRRRLAGLEVLATHSSPQTGGWIPKRP